MSNRFEATNYDFTPFNPVQNWIGGQWKDGTGSETYDVINPRHGKVMSSAKSSTAADVADAVKAAKVN